MHDVDEDKLKELREKMNLVVSTNSKETFNDYYLRRYLRAHKSVYSAFQAILKTNKWRAEYGVEDIHKNKTILKKHKDKAQVLIHRDIVGRPIIYIPVKNLKYKNSSKNVDDIARYFVYCLEEACKKCFEKAIDNLCLVFDLNNFTLPNLNYQLLKSVLWLLDKHYPERLGVCLIINTPQLFTECWPMIKIWIREEMRQKISFVNSRTELRYFLIPEILPTNVISTGHCPSDTNMYKDNIGLKKFDWYVGEMSRHKAEEMLAEESIEGCFLVRKSSTKGAYAISVFTKMFGDPHTKHYYVKNNPRGEFYLSEKHSFCSIPELIAYHRNNTGGLCSQLNITPLSYMSVEIWEIDPIELVLMETVGAGQFGEVRKGVWRQNIDVAVKVMKEGSMSEDDFIKEAKVMKKLQHPNLVRLYGVCINTRPIYIVTEFMKHGSLLSYLRKLGSKNGVGHKTLLAMAIQVCSGMAFLERHNYIHRDLAARNCLVKDENTVKVADFGLARYVIDDEYTCTSGTKFPLRWAPLEVIHYRRYSSKSDVWAFGVLMWEIFSYGKMPYSGLKNSDVLVMVQQGKMLGKPKGCRSEIYNVMQSCWHPTPENRRSFSTLEKQLNNLFNSIDFNDDAAPPVSNPNPKSPCAKSKSVSTSPCLEIHINSNHFETI